MATKGLKNVYKDFCAAREAHGKLIHAQDEIVRLETIEYNGHVVEKRIYQAHAADEKIKAAKLESARLKDEWSEIEKSKWVPALKESNAGFVDAHNFAINEIDLAIFGKLNEIFALIKSRDELGYELSQFSGELDRLDRPHSGNPFSLPNELPWHFRLTSLSFEGRVKDAYLEFVKHFAEKANVMGVQDFHEFKKK